jgi:hypothetical protein
MVECVTLSLRLFHGNAWRTPVEIDLLKDIRIALCPFLVGIRGRKEIEIRKGCRNIITVIMDVLVKEMIRPQTK